MSTDTPAEENSLGLLLDRPLSPPGPRSPEQPKETTPEKPAEVVDQPAANDENDEHDKDAQEEPDAAAKKQPKEKTKPYVNPDRHKTGGTQREKLTPEELTQRMAQIKEQNEKIKQRRLTVQADEDAFKATQALERQKQAETKKLQDTINRSREQNAQRKLDKIGNREWDSGKKTDKWEKRPSDGQPPRDNNTPRRGGPSGRGSANSRPRRNQPPPSDSPDAPQAPQATETTEPPPAET